MRDPDRIDRIIEKLRLAWHDGPDLRLCQLVEVLGSACQTSHFGNHCIFNVEDDLFEIKLDEWREQEESREGDRRCSGCGGRLYEMVTEDNQRAMATQCGKCHGLGVIVEK